MIRSFGNKETEELWQGQRVKLFAAFEDRAERKLAILAAATKLDDLSKLPGNHFEALKGSRKGQYSIRINNQWRVCFRWDKNDAFDVEIVDYH